MAPAALAGLPLARVTLRNGRAGVARDGLLHQLDDPHARPWILGAGHDAGRGGRARARPRKAAQSVLVADHGRRLPRLGGGDPPSRAERVVLRTGRVPPPRDRLDVRGRRRLPARARLPARLGSGAHRPRADLRSHCGLPLLRPRYSADFRPPLAARGGSAQMRRVALAALVALAFPASAFAHANLVSTSPTYRQRLQSPPRAVVLHFDQSVQAEPNAIKVKNEFGKTLSGTTRAGGQTVRVPLKRLPRGPYTVRWHVLSEDGHVVSGVFTFGVRATAPPPTEAYGASGPTTTEHIVRWAYFLSLALLLGGLGFRLLIGREELPPAAERRFYAIVGLGVVATLEVGILAFILRAEDALQLPFVRLLYGDLSSISGGTRFGEAFIAMTLGYAFVAAFVFLAWLTDRRFLLWPALLLGIGFASGLSLSGHSAVDPGSSWLTELADWAHLSAAALWIGGLPQPALLVFPQAPAPRRTAFLRFSRLAPGLIPVVLC